MTVTFERFAAQVIARHDGHLAEEGPEEQTARVAKHLAHFAGTTPLTPVTGGMVDLAGFGSAAVHFRSEWDEYLLLSEAAEALGWPIQQAVAWAEREHADALRDQRELDEERGDGLLGYACLRNFVDLHVWATVDDPEARPDAGGRRWSHSGDWLVAKDRIPSLLLDSPWGSEFMDNTGDLMRHAFKGSFGSVPGLEPELARDEAVRRARRGPALDENGGAA
jgi:hypothetical protein